MIHNMLAVATEGVGTSLALVVDMPIALAAVLLFGAGAVAYRSLGLGAALMFLLDPDRGRRRRAMVRDRIASRAGHSRTFLRKSRHDMANRARGLAARFRDLAGPVELVEDDVLVERVRAKIGRYATLVCAEYQDSRRGGPRTLILGAREVVALGPRGELVAADPGVASVVTSAGLEVLGETRVVGAAISDDGARVAVHDGELARSWVREGRTEVDLDNRTWLEMLAAI